MKNNKMILAVLLVLQLGFVVCFVGVALQNTSAQFTLQTDAGAASVTDEETGGQIFQLFDFFRTAGRSGKRNCIRRAENKPCRVERQNHIDKQPVYYRMRRAGRKRGVV